MEFNKNFSDHNPKNIGSEQRFGYCTVIDLCTENPHVSFQSFEQEITSKGRHKLFQTLILTHLGVWSFTS